MDDQMALEPEDRAPRPGARRSRGVVVAVLAIVASFAGGFTAGYAVDDGPSDAEVAAVGGDGEGADSTVSGDDQGGWEAFGETTSATTIAATDSMSSDSSMPSSYEPPVRTRLFRRTTDAGLSLRAFRTDQTMEMPRCAGGEWCPPPECIPTSWVEVTIVGEWDVTQGGGSLYELRDGEPARVLGTAMAWYTGDGAFGVVVRTAPGVELVRLSLDGGVDEMAPIDGIAALAVPDAGADPERYLPWPAGARLEIVQGGAVSDLALDGVNVMDPRCVPPPPPPPPLPDAGEQPADVAAADAAVRATFASVFGGEDETTLETGVDDPTGLAELRRELRERYPDQLGTVTYEVGELVFVSPTQAAYHFRPIVPSSGEFQFQIGGARLIDGQWKLTRETVCGMFSIGGAMC